MKPAWPELALPGAHSDIVGGYNPEEQEAYFLTRPQFETVPLSTPDTGTRIYQQTCEQLSAMDGWTAIAPLLQAVEISIDTWHDARMPADRYGALQKRSGAAAVIDRPTRNDWSKVVLRVMLDAAQDAGAVFDPILPKDDHLSLRAELNNLCEKALVMGRAARNGQSASGFTTPEIIRTAGLLSVLALTACHSAGQTDPAAAKNDVLDHSTLLCEAIRHHGGPEMARVVPTRRSVLAFMR